MVTSKLTVKSCDIFTAKHKSLQNNIHVNCTSHFLHVLLMLKSKNMILTKYWLVYSAAYQIPVLSWTYWSHLEGFECEHTGRTWCFTVIIVSVNLTIKGIVKANCKQSSPRPEIVHPHHPPIWCSHYPQIGCPHCLHCETKSVGFKSAQNTTQTSK